MTAYEVRDFINRSDKRVFGNIRLSPDSGVAGAFKFRGAVDYDGKPKVELNIWFNSGDRPGNSSDRPPKITIAYFVAGIGRIYGLCMNVRHAGMLIHKHNGKKEDDNPYEPDDITAPAANPQAVWAEFCAESSLAHYGTFSVNRRGLWTPPLTEI